MLDYRKACDRNQVKYVSDIPNDISKVFTSYDLYGMLIPGNIFLFALSYMIGTDEHNFYAIIDQSNIVVSTITLFTFSYVVGTLLSSLGTIIFKRLDCFVSYRLNYDTLKLLSDKKINVNRKSSEIFDELSVWVSKSSKANPKISLQRSLTALAKSMCVGAILIFIVQFWYNLTPWYYWALTLIVAAISFERFERLNKRRQQYILNDFIYMNEEDEKKHERQ